MMQNFKIMSKLIKAIESKLLENVTRNKPKENAMRI